jgi:hypothetical protein
MENALEFENKLIAIEEWDRHIDDVCISWSDGFRYLSAHTL